MFMRIWPMERNLLNSASDFLYHTHFYFKISARWLHCHKHHTCYSIVSCSPLILIGAHFSSLAINQLHDLSLFKNMMKKRLCSEITAFKNSDPGFLNGLPSCHGTYLRNNGTKPVYWSPFSFAQSLRVINWVRQWDIDKFIDVNKTFLRICVVM